MKTIILLAGYGKRMRPHTWSRPKPLLKVAGNTIVGHLIEQLSEILTEEVIFVGDSLRDFDFVKDKRIKFIGLSGIFERKDLYY